MSALRLAWVNPRGLEVKSVGDNTFIEEFSYKQDWERVLDESPWNVGNKLVLVQRFDPNLRPSEVTFDKMPIWIRIQDLPFGLMNNKSGLELTKKIGSVLKVEVDSQGRAWGPFLRAKVQIDLAKPLLRCITIFSEKRQATEPFSVRYEKLPSYCYSCGLIGHSSIVCPTPAERDEKGLLPYGKDLRASEESKLRRVVGERQSTSTGGSISSGGQRDSCEGNQAYSVGQRGSCEGNQAAKGPHNQVNPMGSSGLGERHTVRLENEATPPMKRQVRSGDKKMIGKDGDVSKELILYRPKNQGVKRKQARVPPFQINTIVCDEQEVKHDAMALVIANPQLVQNST